MKIKKEFSFVLPVGSGLSSDAGRKISGVMRLMRVKDLTLVHQDGRLAENPGYFYVVLLSRLVVKLGNEKLVTPKVIENLCPKDFAFLIELVDRINQQAVRNFPISCQHCNRKFMGRFGNLGEA